MHAHVPDVTDVDADDDATAHVPDWRDARINQLWVSRVHDPQIWAPVPILFLNLVDDDINDIMYKCHRINLIRKY